MIRGKGYITDKEFEEIFLPFYDNFNEYMMTYIIPDVVAFYLANSHSRNCLTDAPIRNHINSAIDVFNIRCDIEPLIIEVKKILKIKYNIKIVKNNPLRLRKIA